MLEGMNPYAAPRVDTNPVPVSPSGRTGWKVYTYGLATLHVVGLFFTPPRIHLSHALDAIVTLVGMLGLFGFAYRRYFLGRRIWMIWSLLLPLWDVMMGAWVYPRQAATAVEGVQLVYCFVLLFCLPQYLALIRYAFLSREFWHKGASAG